MKTIKHFIYLFTTMLLAQACFQDMGEPEFNYPKGAPDPTGAYKDLKLHIPFEGNALDLSTYQFIPSPFGTFAYTEGISGKAIQYKSDTAYVIIDRHPAIEKLMKDTLSNLGSYTLAFWMKCERNKAATGIFSLSNTKSFWGNLEVFFENTGSETEAFIKIHMNNIRSGKNIESWQEVRLPDGFKQWNHVVISYNGPKSEFKIYQNNNTIVNKQLGDYGPLVYENVGSMVIGTCQFQTNPSLTSGSKNQSWAGWYTGELDDLRFYNRALTDKEVKALFDQKGK